MKYSTDIYELLEIDEKSEVELTYLSKLAKRLNLLEEVKQHIFDFHPKYDENGRCQTFASYYKEAFISVFVSYLISLWSTNEKRLDLDILSEDFELYFFDKFLEEEDKNTVVKFLLTTDLSDKTEEEIFELFKNSKGIKEYFEEYFIDNENLKD